MFRRTQSGFLGLQIPRQWALGFLPNQLGCFGVTNPRPWDLGFRQTYQVFWGYISPANGPLGSTKHNRGVLGLQTHRQWPSVLPNTIRVFLGLQTHRQWALRFRGKQSRCFGVTNTSPMGHQDPPNTTGLFWIYKSPANGPSGSANAIGLFPIRNVS
ncbi:Hypothetical protein FKW44_022277 [Caligus rogercresseyi]|uniref:Uncharacterized protein n=1 Tax=Caligus rogercresseyi TaxID=217165 RepID=A0A7T8JX08_CALRO|nr:Hypothetical protein FKW44_022277 [Caligus rogercresseyi]